MKTASFDFRTKRHQRLMRESEQALEDAAKFGSERRVRIASQILTDEKLYREWEAEHARRVNPIAQQRRRNPQIIQLRLLETRLLHRSALIDYIREYAVTGPIRDRLFSVFYGPKDTQDAILTEHRHYMLAVGSHCSADHLISVMHDSVSEQLLQLYENAYARYFSLYCFASCNAGSDMGHAVHTAAVDARTRVERLRERILKIRPEKGHANFDREALLSRSGRFPVLDYMAHRESHPAARGIPDQD
ncbi:MAG: hypothetical protein HKN77_03600 [Woeseiaceae bacterium]|nr:hypothetical protein [Woeseiaceae bacterium]